MYTAKKAIKCYKSVYKLPSGNARAVVYRKTYKPGVVYTERRFQLFPTRYWRDLPQSNEGFHSYKDRPTTNLYHFTAVFVIPKGAKYFVNSTERISNQIKFVKFLK